MKMRLNCKNPLIQIALNQAGKSSAAPAAAHKWPFGHSQNPRPLSAASGRETFSWPALNRKFI